MKLRALRIGAFFLALALAASAEASTTLYVDGVNGNDTNDCKTRQTACKTIGHAISLASSGDTIGIGPATYTENLTIGLSLRIVGSGASTTIIDGGAVNTVITISSGTVFLSKLTIRNGKATSGGGIYNLGTLTVSNSFVTGNSVLGAFFLSAAGGGIYNSGTLTIINSTLNGNTATASPRGAEGGGIYNGRTLTINNSTLSANSGRTGYNITGPRADGGGIYMPSGSTTIINNSTLSGNSLGGFQGGSGGGIYNGDGTLTINNSTLNSNYSGADGVGGGIFNGGTLTVNNSTLSGNLSVFDSLGGGIYNAAKVTITNSIVADSSPGNCFGTMTSNGYNLSSDNTCTFNGPGDLNNTDPLLGPLQNNGGPTQTQALLAGSPAIDAGNPNGCTDSNGHLLKTDQRGAPRPDKEDTGGCDMGAFERQSD